VVLLGECDGQNYRQAVIAGSVKKIHVAILVLLVLCLESYSFVPYMFLLVIVCNRLICLFVTHAALIKTYPYLHLVYIWEALCFCHLSENWRIYFQL